MVDVALFLELVQQYPLLYDKKRKDFRDIVKKNNAWKELAETLNSEVTILQMRWRSLRERYAKELRNYTARTRSGQPQIEESSWEWFKYMSFLNDIIKPRKTGASKIINNFETADDDEFSEASTSNNFQSCSSPIMPVTLESDSEEIVEHEEITTPIASTSRDTSSDTQHVNNCKRRKMSGSETVSRSKNKKDKNDNQIDLRLIDLLEKCDSAVEDEDDVFCKALAFELRKVEDVKEKQRRKLKMYIIAAGLE